MELQLNTFYKNIRYDDPKVTRYRHTMEVLAAPNTGLYRPHSFLHRLQHFDWDSSRTRSWRYGGDTLVDLIFASLESLA